MGTTAEKLQAILDSKSAIKAAIEAKNPETMPTDVISQWPTAIGTIPSGNGWRKPADWPDLTNLATTYPPLDSSMKNSIAILFDLDGITNQIRLRFGVSFSCRFSDSPTTIESVNSNTWKYHDFPEYDGTSATRYVWAIVYSASTIFGGLGYGIDTQIAGQTGWSFYNILWFKCSGDASARGWGPPQLVCADEWNTDLNMGTGGGYYITNSYNLQRFSANLVAPVVSERGKNMFANCVNLREIDVK